MNLTSRIGTTDSTLGRNLVLGLAAPSNVVPANPDNLDWIDRLRGVVRRVRWLTDRGTIGRNLWLWLQGMVTILNDGYTRLWQSFYARLPGLGTPTALPLIGQSRGLLQGIGESNDAYALYLRSWLQQWEKAGTLQELLLQVQHYCGGNVRVKGFTRSGKLVDLAANGTITKTTGVAWDWDSISNPEKAQHWSEMWIVIYTPPFTEAPTGTRDSSLGMGIIMPRVHLDALKSILLDWKAARSRVNTVIFAYDSTLFDPSTPATMPDGNFGRWSKKDPANPGARVRSRFTGARYWEPQAFRHHADTVG